MPEAGGYSNTTIGRSARDAISEKCRSTMSGLSWAPHMKSVGGNTSTPAAPAARASRARSTASGEPSQMPAIRRLVDRQIRRERKHVGGHDAQEPQRLLHRVLPVHRGTTTIS